MHGRVHEEVGEREFMSEIMTESMNEFMTESMNEFMTECRKEEMNKHENEFQIDYFVSFRVV